MFKLVTILVLGVLLYRLIFPNARISITHDKKGKKGKDDDYVDYEEMEE